MKTREEKLLLAKLWAVMVDRGQPCHPDAQWSYYKAEYSLGELDQRSWPRDYSLSNDSFSFEKQKKYRESSRVQELIKLPYSALHEEQKRYLLQQKELISGLSDESLPLTKPDWDAADIPLYFEEGEFAGTDCDSKQIAIFRGSLPLKSGDSIHLYLRADDYESRVREILHFKTAIENLRSGKETEDLVKKVFGNIEDTL